MRVLGPTLRAARPRALAVAAAIALSSSNARAEGPSPASAPDAAATKETSAAAEQLRKLTAARDLIRSAPAAALLDGSWSAVLQIATAMTSRRYAGPQPRGYLAHEATRVLYGSSWTAMLALEGYVASTLGGGNFEFLAEASYRADWLFATTLPACPAIVSYGGCGIGVGGFGALRMRPRGSAVTFEAGGGWIEQRVANDERRTVSESMWVLTPLSATIAVETPAAPLGLFVRAGPGVYFGMHNGHLHPISSGAGFPRAPWHEMFPIDAGVGPGGRALVGIAVARRLTIEAEIIAAVLPLGMRRSKLPEELVPLEGSRGVPTFRLFSLGAFWRGRDAPLSFGASVFRAELSTRPLERFGHAGGMVRLEFPLRVTRGE